MVSLSNHERDKTAMQGLGRPEGLQLRDWSRPNRGKGDTMSDQELATTIGDRLKASADLKVVFGDPQVIEGKTIVPVASVAYAFGVGSGGGEGPRGREGMGSGGGGAVRVKPLGVLEITDERTRFVPVVDATRLAMLGIGASVLIALFVARALGKRR
jgi:uncharacterized spore protein YtfJ